MVPRPIGEKEVGKKVTLERVHFIQTTREVNRPPHPIPMSGYIASQETVPKLRSGVTKMIGQMSETDTSCVTWGGP